MTDIDFWVLVREWALKTFPCLYMPQRLEPAATIILYTRSDRKWVASVQLYGTKVGVWNKTDRATYFDLGDPKLFEQLHKYIEDSHRLL